MIKPFSTVGPHGDYLTLDAWHAAVCRNHTLADGSTTYYAKTLRDDVMHQNIFCPDELYIPKHSTVIFPIEIDADNIITVEIPQVN